MENFNLRHSSNQLISELNDTTVKKNIIKLGIDIKLPDTYIGDSKLLMEAIRTLSIFLSNVLVNGIIEIEITSQTRHNDNITLHIQIAGKGNNRVSNESREQLEKIIQRMDIRIAHYISSDQIRFDFNYSLKPAESRLSEQTLPFHNKKILLAEDNEINAMVFSSFLEEWGCENTMAINGEEAVNLAQDKEFDAILMDIFMPVLNGNQATKKIREFNSRIPIIALTASTREEDIREATAVGANDYLLKPVSSAHLFQVLSKYL